MPHKTDFGKRFRIWRNFPLTLLGVVLIWYLCLMPQPSVDVGLFDWFDKLVHACMYWVLCSVFWYEYFHHSVCFTRLRLQVLAVGMPILMSGLIEVAQSYLTTTRSGDWWDFLANSLGVILAWGLSPLYRKLFYKL